MKRAVEWASGVVAGAFDRSGPPRASADHHRCLTVGLALAFALAFPLIALATPGLTPSVWQGPLPQQAALRAVGFSVGSGDGVAVGDGGLVLRTQDGGLSWGHRTSGVSEALHSLWFATFDVGWSVGDGGTVIKTVDRGTAWTRQASGTTRNLNGVYCTCVNNVWAVGEGGTIRRTGTGGATWYGQDSGVSHTLNAVQMASYTATGWIVGDAGTVLVTHDGGAAWTPRDSGVTTDLNSLRFVGSVYGWAAGDDGVVLHTSDGGETWIRQSSGTTATLHGIYFFDSAKGWAVGDGGTIITTIDGGSTWITRDSGTTSDLLALRFTAPVAGDPITGWTVGRDGAVLRSVNRGENWIPVDVDVSRPLTLWPGYSPSFVGKAEISFDTIDTGSGVAHTWYRLDGGAQVEASATTVTVSTPGQHTILFWSQDAAGNVETAQTRIFTVQKLASRLSITSNFTTVLARHSVTFAGGVWPDRAATTRVTLYVRRKGSARWTLLSTRSLYAMRYWSYTWRPSKRGTYYVRARFSGDETYLPAYSPSRRVTVK